MSIDNWDEIRTAYHVARIGTVSGAAEALGVHHATVIRHVDALETALGVKLFQRHARGYTPTEAGQDLLKVAQTTEDQFQQLSARIRGRGGSVSGELVVTSVPDVGLWMTRALVDFRADHPGLSLRYLTDTRLLRLEYGEAHVAIRAGAAPDEPDNVVQPLGRMRFVPCATETYLARAGRPRSETDLAQHALVGGDGQALRVPALRWLADTQPEEAMVFRGTELPTLEEAVLAGAGIGFLPTWRADAPGVVALFEPRAEWDAPLWIVTHVDLHRTTKVQAFLAHLKTAAAGWPLA